MSGIIVAEITPSPEGAAPTFKILRDYQRDAHVRPCEHRTFTLDEKWSTVTCGACGERVDPFAALLRFAEWYDKLDARRREAEAAERHMHVAELRRLSRFRDATETEREEIKRATGWASNLDAAELRQMANRIGRDIRERKSAKRRERGRPDISPAVIP